MRIILFALVAVTLLAHLVASQTIIYQDYTSGFSTILPMPSVNAEQDPMVYNTNSPGSYRFGVDWNQDAQDQFSITIPSTIELTAENDVSFCTPTVNHNPPNQITFTETSPHQCNYTANWTVPFNGVLTVTYNGGPNTNNIRSNAISTFFATSSVIGDPQFVGLRGQSFQVHGVDGAVYNIISEKNSQVNARFVFLIEGECPIIDGVEQSNCWSHPGSYLGEMSFQQVVDGKIHAALVTAGSAKEGFSMVQVDGQELKPGQMVSYGSLTLKFESTHTVSLNIENYEFQLSNSDMFVNQAVRAKVPLSKLNSHGLLGQTHRSKTYAGAFRYIEGRVDDYLIDGDNIFGTEFVYNLFEA